MAVMASETFTSTSAPIQYAAVKAFEGGYEIDNYLRRTRDGYWLNLVIKLLIC